MLWRLANDQWPYDSKNVSLIFICKEILHPHENLLILFLKTFAKSLRKYSAKCHDAHCDAANVVEMQQSSVCADVKSLTRIDCIVFDSIQ